MYSTDPADREMSSRTLASNFVSAMFSMRYEEYCLIFCIKSVENLHHGYELRWSLLR